MRDLIGKTLHPYSCFNVPGIVVLPWYNGAASQLSYYIIYDHTKKEGWEMVYNFCTDSNEFEKYYLMFYNKFTGILRVFYYNKNQVTSGSTTFWQLSFTKTTKLLNSVGYFTFPLSETGAQTTYTSNITNVDNSKAIFYGWNCFDVELAYDPGQS